MRTEKTECRMPNCQRPHIRGECGKNCYYNTRQVTTNADRVRSMTDEELAEFVSGKARTFGEEYEGYMSALDWLKQEVVDDA